MQGQVGILKLTFDRENQVECIRAARIIKDMLRRGYALLVEVEIDGVKKFQRARDFDEAAMAYIIADFDPTQVEEVCREEPQAGDQESASAPIPAEVVREEIEGRDGAGTSQSQKRSYRRRNKSIPADTTRAVAIGRTAGG